MKKISAIDRDDFAKCTDDYNSVHFGPEGIAHGNLVLAWAVGRLCDDGDILMGYTDVQFRRKVPIGLGMLDVRVVEREGRRTLAEVYNGSVKVVVFTMWRKDRANSRTGVG